jgi:hypothetical protein
MEYIKVPSVMITAKEAAEIISANIDTTEKDRIERVQKELAKFHLHMEELLSDGRLYLRYQTTYTPFYFHVYYADKSRELTLDTMLFTEEIEKLGFRTTYDYERGRINVFWRPKGGL